MSNYDQNLRIEVEKYIISIIITFDKEQKFKELFKKHHILNPNYFIVEEHRAVFSAYIDNWSKNIPNDLLTVYASLVNNPFREHINNYLLSIINGYSISSVHLEHYIWQLKQFLLMDFWNWNAGVIQNTNWSNVDVIHFSENLIDAYQNLFKNLTENFINNSTSIIDETKDLYNKRLNGEPIGVPTGIEEFDAFTGGFIPGELSIIAGRPGTGKTTIAIILMHFMSVVNNYKGVFFSLEMTRKQLLNKLIAMITGIDYQKIRHLDLTTEEFYLLQDYYSKFENNPNIVIVDNTIQFNDIVSHVEKNNYDYCFIDYLQLMQLSSKTRKNINNREQEISYFSRGLKSLAKKANLPVISLSQLSRSVENRLNKRPILSDLRESGAIEQDADNIIFPYRDSYYRKMAGELVIEEEEGNVEFNLAKGRETGTKLFKIHIDFKSYKIVSGFKFKTFEG